MNAFSCRMCGHCCEGKGGIVLSATDQKRLAEHLEVGVEELLARYTDDQGGKPCVTTGKDGYCIFFSQASGCGVHPARPDICRAWPFFRGNLIDEGSWVMIQEYCPGVNPDTGHAEFVRQGRGYLRKHGLLKRDRAHDPVALVLGADLDDQD